MTTPRKITKNICIICKISSLPSGSSWRCIDSQAGRNKNLSNLIAKYVELRYIEGAICRACETKLLEIDKLVCELKEKSRENQQFVSEKRCLPEIENTPIIKKRGAKVKTELFTSRPESDSSDLLTTSRSNLNDTDIRDSGFKSWSALTPILPKFNISPDSKENYPLVRLTSTPKPVARRESVSPLSNVPVIQTASENNFSDHTYAVNGGKVPVTNKQPKVGKQKGKNLQETDLFKKLKNDFVKKPEISDFLTNEEFSSVISILPLRSRHELVKCLLTFVDIRTLLQNILIDELSKDHRILKNRKRGELSVLMTKDYDDLKNFQWDEVVLEAVQSFPMLVQTLLAFMLPDSVEEKVKYERLSSLVPRIGLLYAILAQGRNIELSKVQRIISVLLFDTLCDQKVFDRLQPIGVCLSYGHGLTLLDKFSGNYNAPVIEALKAGKKIRLVGDNINWRTQVHDERQDNHGKMHHAFGSAVIIQTLLFGDMNNIKPQRRFTEVESQSFLPSVDEWEFIRDEYAVLMIQVAIRLIPYFKAFDKCTTKQFKGPLSEKLVVKNKVVPLPVLHLNEQKYDDVVQIMDFYEKFLEECFEKAEIPMTNNTHVLIGGDQLTRERFSGAKRLRSGSLNPKDRFQHLSPITFELFHMLMNYVKVIFKLLYNDDSIQEMGTLKCEANRLLRNSVNPNVNDHFDADKDFIVSFVDAYIVEAVLHHFDMEDELSAPRKNVPKEIWSDENEKREWIMEMFRKIVDKYVWSKEKRTTVNNVEEDGVVIPVTLANGRIRSFVIKTSKKAPPKDDRVKNYANLTLELGLRFKSILDLCKMPDRDRGLRLLKVAMIHFKASNHLSKYADEILRLLVHQYCVLSEQEAHEEFYSLFVNTKGRIDSHIPCDLQMEYIVKSVKRNIKHMFSNKTEGNITTRTSALPVMKDISENFDRVSDVLVRCKKHSDLDSNKDELDIIKDLRQLKPFDLQPGRVHQSFRSVENISAMQEAL